MRHKSFHHDQNHARFYCEWYDCKYSALRSDHLRYHMWSVHIQDDRIVCTEESRIARLFKKSLEEQRKMSHSCLLLSALGQENSTQVGLLLANGADPNSVTPEGATALHFAIVKGNNHLVRTLLEAGARVDVQDRWGFTGLEAAIKLRQEFAGRIKGFWDPWAQTEYRAVLQLLLTHAVELWTTTGR